MFRLLKTDPWDVNGVIWVDDLCDICEFLKSLFCSQDFSGYRFQDWFCVDVVYENDDRQYNDCDKNLVLKFHLIFRNMQYYFIIFMYFISRDSMSHSWPVQWYLPTHPPSITIFFIHSSTNKNNLQSTKKHDELNDKQDQHCPLGLRHRNTGMLS